MFHLTTYCRYSIKYKDAKIEVNQEKWYRDFADDNITIKYEIYTLSVNESKRTLVYDENNKLIGTKPLILKNGEIVDE